MKTIKDFDYKKAVQAINFFANENKCRVDKLATLKLIWLADRHHLRKFGRPILNDTYYAMKLGPVASSLKDILGFSILGDTEEKYLKNYLELDKKNVNKIYSIKGVDLDVFSDSDIESLKIVYDKYGKLSGSQLVELSHKFPEWKKFETALKNGSSTRESMSYVDFFDNTDQKIKNNIFTESEKELKHSKKIFEENYEIANYWI